MTSEEAALRDERGPVGSDRGAFGRFMTEAEASPDVLGVILMGSRGFDHFVTPRSDHDALVIVAKDPFPWQRDHGSAVETWPMTIGQFRTHGLTVDVWNRAAFLGVRVILDRLDGEILRLVEEKRTLRPDEAEALGANRVDGYINSLVRSLRNLEAGREVEGRLDAIESIGPLLEAVFAFEGRVRPFNKWLRYETAERPLAFGDIVGLVDQIATCPTADIQRAVFRQFEVAARTGPDPNSNRVAIVVSAPSARLFKALAEHFGTEAIELRIDDSMFGAEPGSGRQHDTPPFWGGASIQSAACSDGFPWTAGVTGNAILTAAHCFSGGGSAKIGDYTGAGSVLSGSEENWDPVHGTQFYSGQTTYRGDVALIRLTGSYRAEPYIYRAGVNSISGSAVISRYTRSAVSGDVVYVSGRNSGDTGPYTVDLTHWDFLYHPPSDEWVRNVSSASRGALTTCAGPGDSGGAVFSTVSGGVQAAGIFSGFLVCRIYFTPIYDTFLALPGDVLLH